MKKPNGWYGIRANCSLLEILMSNMIQPEQAYKCKRKDRKGEERPSYELLRCHWNVCPKLKKERKEQ